MVSEQSEWSNWLDGRSPGDRVEIKFTQRGVDKITTLELQEDPSLEVIPFEHAGLELGRAEKELRAVWLGSKSPYELEPMQKYCGTCKRGFEFQFENCKFDGATLELLKQ